MSPTAQKAALDLCPRHPRNPAGKPIHNPHSASRFETECETCGKRLYRSRGRAKTAIRNMHDPGMREYRCELLNGWHIGHLPAAVIAGERTIRPLTEHRRPNAIPQPPMPAWGQDGSRTARERANLRYRRAIGRQQHANDAGYGIPAVRLMRAHDRQQHPRPDYREWGR